MRRVGGGSWLAYAAAVVAAVYAVVSFLVTFHRLVVGLPLAGVAIGFEAVLCFGPAAPPEASGMFVGPGMLRNSRPLETVMA